MIGQASAMARREPHGWAMLDSGMNPPRAAWYRAWAPAICGHMSLLVLARPGQRQVWACDVCGREVLHELNWTARERPRFWMFAGGELALRRRRAGRGK